jgi:DNA-binding MarR family transcriptional regulator/N-acetylglutamate synthase-like GNAT family acetyltransferase
MDYIKKLNGLALASRMKRLVEKLNSDMKGIYHDRNLDFEPLLMPIMKLLNSQGPLSVNEITEFLGTSQPAVTQFCSILLKRKLIRIETTKSDKRKKKVEVSKQGVELLEKLSPIWNEVDTSINSMMSSSDHNLLKAIEDFESQHTTKSLKERVIERLKGQDASRIKIVNYKDKYRDEFKKLNYEWISKNFIVEKSDEYVLTNPEKAVIEKGGFIFFARYNDEIVGTFALVKVDDNTFEIAKMAVTERCQKLGVGQKLLDHAFEKAKDLKLKRLILYSNTLLAPAINLYFKNGFKVIPKTDLHNNRANIKMEKVL